jgi:hypothetical protein
MSAPPRNSDSDLNKRDQLAVSTGVMAEVPWGLAAGAGVVVGGGDLLLHLMTGHLGLGSAMSAGVMALFAVAGAGVMLRKQGSRAVQWARRNPWSFAVLPGAATAIIVFVIATILGSSGLFGGAFTAFWHGAIAFGVTGVAAGIGNSRRQGSGR